jgi:hypothetical protein
MHPIIDAFHGDAAGFQTTTQSTLRMQSKTIAASLKQRRLAGAGGAKPRQMPVAIDKGDMQNDNK